jgi:hypothetical protein
VSRLLAQADHTVAFAAPRRAIRASPLCDITPPLRSCDNYFTTEQLDEVKRLGAVGQVCMRFVDADGAPIPSGLDDLVVGVTTKQLKAAGRRWAVAGGRRRRAAGGGRSSGPPCSAAGRTPW